MSEITTIGNHEGAVAPAAGDIGGTTKLSINVSSEIGQRLRRLGFEQRLSESSIVEVALQLLFQQGNDADLGSLLRENGASLRRRRP
jgi:hypothetical protein